MPRVVWQAGVYFDFAQGLAGHVTDSQGQLELFEAVAAGGEVIQMARGEDWAVHFPGRCRIDPLRCPRAILESGPADFLNPGARRIRWGASVRMTANETSDGGNVLQKGLSASGSQFKLQIDGYQGRPSCVIAGDETKYIALSWQGIADGGWHELVCERRTSLLMVYVDGRLANEVFVPRTLSIVNNAPLRLGGKGHGPYNDQFHGTLDDVFVEIA